MPNSALVPTALAAALFAGFVGFEIGQQSAGSTSPATTAPTSAALPSMSVHFSPHGGCEQEVIDELAVARNTVDVQAYSFTSPGIAQALADAEARGVHVRAILDEKAAAEPGSKARFLASNNVPTWLDGVHPIAHNKVMIIDGQTVITGSFNFTRQAENANAENLLVIHSDTDLAQQYEQNFAEHLGHSQAYHGEAISAEHSSRGERERSAAPEF
jgi:phosphatidylserine/phosphatidylglycerophosphate/cardiolipin synthase-like enzyme